MHILVITPGFPVNENDTGCIPSMQEYFRKQTSIHSSLKITVIAIHYPYKNEIYFWRGIKVHSLNGRGTKQPKRFFFWLKAIKYSLMVNKEFKIDLIHSFWLTESSLIGALLGKLFKIKHITTMMGQDVRAGNKYLKLLPLNKIIKVAVSENHAKAFYQSTKKNADYVIPWGIEEPQNISDDRPVDIIGVGALIPVKNYKLFIKIISELKKKFPSIRCLLAGGGKERAELDKIIKNLDLEKNIYLTGRLKREEVLERMKGSKILLHTSFFESYGYVLAEALSAGCYVVCRETGCAVESEKMSVVKNDDEFLPAVEKILKHGNDYSPLLLSSLDNTANSYFELYEKYSG